jgi:VCBS repeat protein
VSLSPDRVADVNWAIVAAGDLDGDRDVDIVWRNALSGVVVGWLMQGPTLAASRVIGQVDDLAWQVRASGDFNADGRADLVWQHQGDGRIGLWFMDGLQTIAGELLPQVVADTNWQIVGTGDFDRDGRRDLLWHHQGSGEIGVWLMDGRRLIDGQSLGYFVQASSQIRAVADVDGNGSADWLWQQADSGQVVVWLMDGLTLLSGGLIGSFAEVDNDWRVVGPR